MTSSIGKFLNTYLSLAGKNVIIREDDIPVTTQLPDFLISDISLMAVPFEVSL